MDKGSKLSLGQLTHVLIRGLGWLPVDGGKTESRSSDDSEFIGADNSYEIIVFKAEGKTVAVDGSLIEGWKFK